MPITLKSPAECKILVVDDEKGICEFLKAALQPLYPTVDTCLTADAALACLDETAYDVVITDLKLPDKSGLEVLRYAKQKDSYLEVLIITGYASIESAAEAINLGVTSYMLKPLSLADLLAQVEKAVSMRIFHHKSLMLLSRPDQLQPEIQGHVQDITSLYYFSRKLMLPLEIAEIMRIVLEETNERFDAAYSIIGINFLGFIESYAMARSGDLEESTVRKAIMQNWGAAQDIFEKKSFKNAQVPLHLFQGCRGKPAVSGGTPLTLSMTVLGRDIGFITIFPAGTNSLLPGKNQLLYVFASMVSSIIEHGYVDLQAKMQAKTDSLTGIANHRLFHESLEREIARATRHGHGFCLALLDIDDFKKVNDIYGHLIGDAVLIDLTERIGQIIRKGDILARYGGEEFALILPDTDLHGAEILANRICQAIAAKPFTFSRTRLHYTVSIGLSRFDGTSPKAKDQLIADSDEALYASKHAGKNRVSVK